MSAYFRTSQICLFYGGETLREQGYQVFLEIGASPVLLGMGRRCLPDINATWLPSLRRGQSDWEQMLGSLAELYMQGAEVDWEGFDTDYSRQRLQLPTYPFEAAKLLVSTFIESQ